MEPILAAKNLSKEYTLYNSKVKALTNVTVRVAAGEFVAIMGPSGSGKTTLLQLLGGLDRPTTGQVELAGTGLGGLSDDDLTAARRKHIGFVFQFFHLIPVLTARENVALPLTLAGLDSAKYADRIDSLLALVGLKDRQHHFPSQLSGGQQQRVALARALVLEPAVLLADEPTGALDVRTGQEVMGLMRRFRDEKQQTVVVVTHDVNVAAYADRVIFLQDGQIAREVKVSGDRRKAAGAILDVLESLLPVESGGSRHA
jgi:putative ABC transport system ATP-binding protein